MGKLTVEIPDEVERKLRVKVAEKYVGKKGALGEAITDAIRLWLRQEELGRKP